jgi:PAS domain S-box-containing protein
MFSITFSEQALLQFSSSPNLFSGDSGSDELKDVLSQMKENGYRYLEPMVVRNRIIGFIGLGLHSRGGFLNSEDLALVKSFCDFAAIAFDNAMLYRSLEMKAAELMQLQHYSESVVESIRLGVAVVSPEGRITVWNSAMSDLIAVSRKDAIGNLLFNSIPTELSEALKELTDGPGWQVSGMRHLYKSHVKLPDGESRLLNVTLTPFFSEQNINTGTLIVVDDITDKVHLENQLQQAEKLSSIGLFAAGIAHEVNTPLTGISSYVQMLINDTPDGDSRKELLKKVEKQSFRASEIVNNLLNFARVSNTDFGEVQVNSLIMDSLSLIKHQFQKSGVEIDFDIDPSLPRTVGNGGKLQQVFMNIFLNARDAMPEGGDLRIRTYSEAQDLVVEVEDSGQGITEEDIKRIYDPFFTTKSVGKGTGLGLSVSYGIIQEHSGSISVKSDPGKGSVFSIRLPIRRIH